MDRQTILDAISRHISQRSGIDARNYRRDWNDKEGQAALMSDYRSVLRDGKDARVMLRAVQLSSMPAKVLLDAFRAFSGRLSYIDGKGCEYCTGQYFPTEYRAAACVVLSTALHNWYATDCPKDARIVPFVNAWAKRNLGRAIAKRWFL